MKCGKTIIGFTSVLIFMALWEVCGQSINPVFLSPPTEIAKAFYEIGIKSSILSSALFETLSEFSVGFVIAVPVGVLLGLFMGYFRFLDYILDPFVSAIYATPRIVFIPLIVLWFGLGFEAKVFFIILMAIFPVLMNTYAGVKNIESSYVELARSFKARDYHIMSKVVLPGSLPYIIAGIRLSAGMAIIGVILAEMFTAMTGLGFLLIKYGNKFKTAKLFAVIITIALLALVINEIIKQLEKRTLRWKTTQLEET